MHEPRTHGQRRGWAYAPTAPEFTRLDVRVRVGAQFAQRVEHVVEKGNDAAASNFGDIVQRLARVIADAAVLVDERLQNRGHNFLPRASCAGEWLQPVRHPSRAWRTFKNGSWSADRPTMAAASPMRPPCEWQQAGQRAAVRQALASTPRLPVVRLRRQRILVDKQVDQGALASASEGCGSGACATCNAKRCGRDAVLPRTTLIKSPAAASALVACAGDSSEGSVAVMAGPTCQAARNSRAHAPARPRAPQPCAFRTACLTSCAAWRATATATLGPASCSARRSELLRLRAPALVTVALARGWTHAATAMERARECELYRRLAGLGWPSRGARGGRATRRADDSWRNLRSLRCPSRPTRLTGRERRRRRGAAAACSLDMEEAGLGTTLPTQQWSGFERFKEVQEILDRNKCATLALLGCSS